VNKLARHIATTQIRYHIPTLLWLRLRWLCRHNGSDMLATVCRVLRTGLDTLGVPAAAEDLLDPEGRLQRRNGGEETHA